MGEPAWRFLSASVTGPSHVLEGRPNQDAALSAGIDGRAHFLAVADGAGSRPRSREGAQQLVKSAYAAARAQLGQGHPATPHEWKRLMRVLAGDCLRRFDDWLARRVRELPARGRGDPVVLRSQFAATLLAAVIAPPFVSYLNIGDGFLIVERAGGGAQLVLPPPTNRSDAGETVFATSLRRAEALEVGVVLDGRVNGVALCTDGLTEALLAGDGSAGYDAPDTLGAYFSYFADPAVPPEQLAKQLGSEDFAGTSGDDKTMALAVRLR
ncbi:protein phosphatase 2C domain-containing protein [Nonomuraea sp. FMUSA5-5]|uniref:Protein phosphatase 2C domain-containing protein n=1 Tax=Nonomuraea composti TaxID=2720023 RepID=A0ABX1B5L0_9ACTN|nr:PP2C family serine/threonine-protein phosphatase [Nonomuraea sp. FMUSA5-5]NJP91722.1 protein phosphatase 2C domain-containing protein [Nonomuraea sp. FMUSA5-5]